MSGYEKKNTSSVLSHPYRVLVFSEGRISTTRTRISDCTCDLPYLCASHQPASFNHIGRQKSDNATAKASEPESRARRDKRRSCSSRRNVIARRTSDKFRRRLLREALNPWIRAPTKCRSMTELCLVVISSQEMYSFTGRLLGHESCSMNRLQESHEHSQVSPRKPLRSPASFEDSLDRE